MDYMCPICNGLAALSHNCSQCGSKMEDHGRFDSFLSDYSPYRQIDDLKMTNTFIDLASKQCIHVTFCPQCQTTENVAVSEWSGQQALANQ
jgi:hypothetical protein